MESLSQQQPDIPCLGSNLKGNRARKKSLIIRPNRIKLYPELPKLMQS